MQVSWINPEDVAALAESLRTPSPKPRDVTTAAGGLSLLEDDPEGMVASDQEEPPHEVETMDASGRGQAVVEARLDTPAALPTPVPTVALPAEPDVQPVMEAPAAGGFEGGPDLHALRQRLQQIRERAVDAGLLPAITGAIKPPPLSPPVGLPVEPAPRERPPMLEVPLGSVMARLEAFANWSAQYLRVHELFVVDDRGDLLWGAQEQAGIVLSTLMAMSAAARSNASAACDQARAVTQVLPSGKMLTALPCDTRLGRMQIAVAATSAVSAEDARDLCETLQRLMNADDGGQA